MNNLETLKAKLKKIYNLGYIDTHRSGPTGIGKTLEDLLEIPENNIALPDLDELGELKSVRNNQTSMMTLFTKSPMPNKVNSILLEKYGYIDINRNNKKILHTTVKGTGFNTVNGTGHGFKISFKNDRIILLSNFPEQVNAYWNRNDLKEIFEKKLPKLILVKANTRGKGKNEQFHFVEAYQLSGFSFENFVNLIKNGTILIDIRIGQYPDGRTHDHGTAFRVINHKLDQLFSNKIKLL